MPSKDDIYRASKRVLAMRDEAYAAARTDERFIRADGLIYPYDSIHSNMDDIFTFFDELGFTSSLESNVKSLIDIGCANGELSYTFSLAGYDVTALDFSFKHDQAPLLVSMISERFGLNIPVIDMSVDRYFDLASLAEHAIAGPKPSLAKPYDFAICLGLLYHLRNPFAFLESLSKITRRCLLGTHLTSYLPDLRMRVDNENIAYLVDAGELNSDPTNYWIFTHKSIERLVKRCGFRVIGSKRVFNNPQNLSVPDRPELGERALLLLESET